MKRTGRFDIGTRGGRLALVAVSVAFACGFAGLGTDADPWRSGAIEAAGARVGGSVAANVRPDTAAEPAPGAAHPDLAAPRPGGRERRAWRSASRGVQPLGGEGSRAARSDDASGRVAVRPSAFAADIGELAWRAVHGGVDGRLWRGDAGAVRSNGHGRGLDGIGFPAIARSAGAGTRVYRPLVAWRDVPDGRVPIPHVRCMGLRPTAVARRAARYEARIVELAMENGISASLVKAVITVESCFDPNAISPVGAIGLMQLMPGTAAWLKVADPHDPDANLRGGIRYLASLRRRFGDTTLALAAYNAGPGNVRRYGGVPPFAETRGYVTRVMANHRRYVAATALASR